MSLMIDVEKLKNENNLNKWNNWYTELPDYPSEWLALLRDGKL